MPKEYTEKDFTEDELLYFVLEILSKDDPISKSDRVTLYSINQELKRRDDGGKQQSF